jgi:hypothetical protein
MTTLRDRPAFFDDLEPGQEWGVSTWIVAPDFCSTWEKVIGEKAPAYGASGNVAYAPPSLAFIYLTECTQDLMPNRAQGGVHARQELTFGVPIKVGDHLSTRMTVSNKYIKRERRYVEITTETRNQKQELSFCRASA